MERYTMCMNTEARILLRYKLFPNWFTHSTQSKLNSQEDCFVDIDNLNLKCIWNSKKTERIQLILKMKKKKGRLTLPDSRFNKKFQ